MYLVNALVGYLPLVGVKVVILYLYKLAGHCSIGNVKNTVKVQTLLFGGTFPYADVFPSFTFREIRECMLQLIPKTILCVELAIVSEGAKIIELL